MDLLGLARKKVIKARKRGLSFDPTKKPKIPLLIGVAEWKEEVCKEFRKKVQQANVVIFAILPGMDEPGGTTDPCDHLTMGRNIGHQVDGSVGNE